MGRIGRKRKKGKQGSKTHKKRNSSSDSKDNQKHQQSTSSNQRGTFSRRPMFNNVLNCLQQRVKVDPRYCKSFAIEMSLFKMEIYLSDKDTSQNEKRKVIIHVESGRISVECTVYGQHVLINNKHNEFMEILLLPFNQLKNPRGVSVEGTVSGRCCVISDKDLLTEGELYASSTGEYIKYTGDESMIKTIKYPELSSKRKERGLEYFDNADAAAHAISNFFSLIICTGCQPEDLDLSVKVQKDRVELASLFKSSKQSKYFRNDFGDLIRICRNREESLVYCNPLSTTWYIRSSNCKIGVSPISTSLLGADSSRRLRFSCEHCKKFSPQESWHLRRSYEMTDLGKAATDKIDQIKQKKKELNAIIKKLTKKYQKAIKECQLYETFLTQVLKLQGASKKKLHETVHKYLNDDSNFFDKDDECSDEILEIRADIVSKATNTIIGRIATDDIDALAKCGFISKNSKNIKVLGGLFSQMSDCIQRARQGKSLRGIRYNKQVWDFAVAMAQTNEQAYDMLRKLLPLPTLRHIKQNRIPVPSNDGARAEDVEILRKKLMHMKTNGEKVASKVVNGEEFFLVAASMDAMTIASNVFLGRGMNIIGFPNNDIMDEKEAINGWNKTFLSNKDLARYATAVVITNIVGPRFTFPVASFFTSITKGNTNAKMLMQVIGALSTAKIIPIIWSFDGASDNNLMIKLLSDVSVKDIAAKLLPNQPPTTPTIQPVTTTTTAMPIITMPLFCNGVTTSSQDIKIGMCHPIYDEFMMYFSSDIVHVLKKLAGCLTKSGNKEVDKRFTRLLKNNNQLITITQIRSIVNEDKNTLQLLPYKMHVDALYPTNWSKMRVYLAYMLFSDQLQQRIERLKDANNIELIKLMQNVRGIWDIMNGKDAINGKSEKWNELNGYLQYFYNWKNCCNNPGPGLSQYPHQRDIQPEFITKQCFNDLVRSCTAVMLCIKMYFNDSDAFVRRMNSDVVEQFFSKIRGLMGNDSASNAEAFRNAAHAIQQSDSHNIHINSSARGRRQTTNYNIDGDGAVCGDAIKNKRKRKLNIK